ncbi:MAG: hypothetical protein PWP72_590 [Thermoanaerobacter sp.]|jgi:hypothetical protein|uniref:hypothetical protein n=1 Tax=Desulfofundulus thermocisternus TaxID=42471 RepID=UPI0004814FFC|nr:hypothetical protein [Desulfofundulus thermocisternus]MDK2887712.1 hypothetical protein [Thermoanaerobacter sp.]
MEVTQPHKTIVVSIQGWELEVLEGPRRVNVDLMGEMLEFKGIWLTEPERGVVTVLCYPEKVFYLEITEEEMPVKRPGRRNNVTFLRPIDQNHDKDK